MRGLILALVLGTPLQIRLQAQTLFVSPAPAPSPALTQFENQLDTFGKQADAAREGTVFPTPQQSRKFFPGLKPAAAPLRPRPLEVGIKSFGTTPTRPRRLWFFTNPNAAPKPIPVCAVPLNNVLRGQIVDGKMVLSPGADLDSKIHIAAVPAPSCNDVK